MTKADLSVEHLCAEVYVEYSKIHIKSSELAVI